MSRLAASLILALAVDMAADQGPRNLLENPSAADGLTGWRTRGDAKIQDVALDLCFVVRNGGTFQQRVALPPDAPGKFVLFIARVSSERVEADITDRPYLYGITWSAEGRALIYNQGQAMRGIGTVPNEWATAWGIFLVPENAVAITFDLNQALRRGVPHTGSAARFDDAGLYVFDTRDEAEAFVRSYKGNR